MKKERRSSKLPKEIIIMLFAKTMRRRNKDLEDLKKIGSERIKEIIGRITKDR